LARFLGESQLKWRINSKYGQERSRYKWQHLSQIQ